MDMTPGAGACSHDGKACCSVCADLEPPARKLLRVTERLDTVKPAQTTPIIPRLAYAGRTTLIAGREGSGKSTLLRASLAAMTTGQDWLSDKDVKPVPALWVGEEWPGDVKAEFQRFEDELGMNQTLIHVLSIRDVKEDTEALHAVIAALGVRICIIDPLADLVHLSQNNAPRARAAVSQIWPQSPDVAVVGVLHAPKGSLKSYAGSHGLGGACDLLLTYGAPESCDIPGYRELFVFKSRFSQSLKHHTEIYLESDGVRYTETEKYEPSRAKQAPSEAEVFEFLRANSGIAKTKAAAHFDIRPGGTARWKRLGVCTMTSSSRATIRRPRMELSALLRRLRERRCRCRRRADDPGRRSRLAQPS